MTTNDLPEIIVHRHAMMTNYLPETIGWYTDML